MILGMIILGAMLGYGWAFIQPKVYTATASAILSTGASTDIGTALASDNYAKSRVKSYLDIGQSRTVADEVIDKLDLDISPDALVSKVSVTNPTGTAVLRVSADGSTPELAMNVAQAWIDGMAIVVEDLESGSTPLLDENGNPIESFVSLKTLDTATLPRSPSRPDVRLAVLAGGFIGLLLGFAVAVARFYFDKRIHTASQIEQQFGLPVIGMLPVVKRPSKNGRSKVEIAQNRAFGEAVRKLRTNLRYMNIDNPPRVLIVTSPSPSEGKSTVTRALARSISESGEPVIAVDADLRLPTLINGLNVVEGSGLTELLIERARIGDVLQSADESGRFAVIQSGALPPNPSEVLGSHAMKRLLEELSRQATVVLDTPPLIPVTDAAMLSANTDGAIIVVKAGKTTIDELGAALKSLDRIGGRPLGIVLNQIKWNQSRDYYEYYGPSSKEQQKSSKSRQSARRSNSPQQQ